MNQPVNSTPTTTTTGLMITAVMRGPSETAEFTADVERGVGVVEAVMVEL